MYNRKRTSMYFFASLLALSLLSACATLPNNLNTVTIKQHNYQGRKIEVWAWGERNKNGVILFSHGADSTPAKYKALIKPWVEAGYRVYAPLHVDSSDHPHKQRYNEMAAWSARLDDMRLLADIYGENGYIAAGHSSGALVALASGGVKTATGNGRGGLRDKRVSVVLAYSPASTADSLVNEKGFKGLRVPALVQIATNNRNANSEGFPRQAQPDAFRYANAEGNRFALILNNADHCFGGTLCRSDPPSPPQQKALAITSDISLLMMQAYNQHQPAAEKQLRTLLRDKGAVVLLMK